MEGVVVRRVIPSDNSCLFNAVGYVMEHDKHKAPELRQVIAATVGTDPIKYNEAFLGKPNPEYIQWILNPEKWGGAIELSILSEYYGREIGAYDIQTTRCDLYGQDKKYKERVMLIYDGLHYDALAMSPSEDAPEEFDQTIFPVYDGTIGLVERLALKLVKDANRVQHGLNTLKFIKNKHMPTSIIHHRQKMDMHTIRLNSPFDSPLKTTIFTGRGVTQTLQTSLFVVVCAKLELLEKRRLSNTHKPRAM